MMEVTRASGRLGRRSSGRWSSCWRESRRESGKKLVIGGKQWALGAYWSMSICVETIWRESPHSGWGHSSDVGFSEVAKRITAKIPIDSSTLDDSIQYALCGADITTVSYHVQLVDS